jgi:hypothetical protein
MSFWVILSLIIAFFLIAVLGMAIRLVFIKGAEARGGCAGKNPLLADEGVACSMCGAMANEECREDEIQTR